MNKNVHIFALTLFLFSLHTQHAHTTTAASSYTKASEDIQDERSRGAADEAQNWLNQLAGETEPTKILTGYTSLLTMLKNPEIKKKYERYLLYQRAHDQLGEYIDAAGNIPQTIREELVKLQQKYEQRSKEAYSKLSKAEKAYVTFEYYCDTKTKKIVAFAAAGAVVLVPLAMVVGLIVDKVRK